MLAADNRQVLRLKIWLLFQNLGLGGALAFADKGRERKLNLIHWSAMMTVRIRSIKLSDELRSDGYFVIGKSVAGSFKFEDKFASLRGEFAFRS